MLVSNWLNSYNYIAELNVTDTTHILHFRKTGTIRWFFIFLNIEKYK
jgi:hypothetical protein